MNDDVEDNEPGEYHEPEIYYRVAAYHADGGKIDAQMSTNDDRDLGYRSGYSEWTTTYRDLESFKKSANFDGGHGVSGVRRYVTLDGEDFTPERYELLKAALPAPAVTPPGKGLSL